MSKKKEQTWWALKMPDGSLQTDIEGTAWMFTSSQKRDNRRMAGGGIQWVKVKLVEVNRGK